MNWFSKLISKPSPNKIRWWIGSVGCDNDKANFHVTRKNCQNELFGEVFQTLFGEPAEHNGEIAFLLVHLLSGRCAIPFVRESLRSVNESNLDEADRIFKTVSTEQKSQVNGLAMFLCSLEVTNETLESHYENALSIADFGVERWPDVGELWRQRGVLKIALGRYSDAARDLAHAKSLNPSMLQLEEPIECATKLSDS